ncbi:MAG: Phosphoribosylglycinamide formyltransferase [candidate division TA06 bacterium ADurb.Bin131]|uniref:Phosphoribosylglycinamide formyltransferase n=1 Tax=candidate division TA06 bacterium ADurb.Bin131 TaxID=1852827 RepID=A0A1V6CCQ1_UNCT6|nr:MAG: Phosphoribosylglycinamide formyltransferase [candidate division TA06 bacterium ADurb.Bin131]HOC02590.1 phosphoribosylglycinamide formyltransferase [bacterium]HQL64304.1 phosphoribosylglycinamide formyltransferase [bacterium]
MFTIGVLASGKGSNLEAIIKHIQGGFLNVKIGVVISDNPDAHALEIAKSSGIPAIYIEPGKYRTFLENTQEEKYIECLKKYEVEFVCLAGFMRVIKKNFFAEYTNRIINIHPSLLPSFPGLEAWKQALDYGVKFTGCTVHFVEEDIDTGPIILQAVVNVLNDDTPEILHQRIQEKEHIIYPIAIKLISENRVRRKGRRVIIDED